MSEPIAELKPTPVRRAFGIVTLAGLGAILLWMGLSQPFAAFGWKLFVIALSGVVLYAAMRLQQATALTLTLTEDALTDSDGHVLARLDDISKVERGMLAFKPSNGFMITTRTRQPRRWRPGLYWITGRKIGIGGVTPGGQAKFMADTINMILAQRRGDL